MQHSCGTVRDENSKLKVESFILTTTYKFLLKNKEFYEMVTSTV